MATAQAQIEKPAGQRPTDTVLAEGKTPIRNVPAPGTVAPYDGVDFQGLGRLNELVKSDAESADGKPFGEHVVVLVDFLLGPDRTSFTRGRVAQLSQVVRGYADPPEGSDLPTWTDAEKRAELKRMFDIGAIRLATSDEVGQEFVNVNSATETPEVREERDKRIAAEARIKELEAKLGVTSDTEAASEGTTDTDDEEFN